MSIMWIGLAHEASTSLIPPGSQLAKSRRLGLTWLYLWPIVDEARGPHPSDRRRRARRRLTWSAIMQALEAELGERWWQ